MPGQIPGMYKRPEFAHSVILILQSFRHNLEDVTFIEPASQGKPGSWGSPFAAISITTPRRCSRSE